MVYDNPEIYDDDTTPGGSSSGNLPTLETIAKNFEIDTGETITAGQLVSIVNGKIRAGYGISAYPSATFNPATTVDVAIAALSSTKFVVAFADSGDASKIHACIGDIVAGAITFGAEYTASSAGEVTNSSGVSIGVLTATKFVLGYKLTGTNRGYTIIGDVTGNVIAFGAETQFHPAGAITQGPRICILSATQFVVVFYLTAGTALQGIVGTVAGNVITYTGVEHTINNTAINYSGMPSAVFPICLLDTNTFVVVYSRTAPTATECVRVCTVAGTVITAGAEQTYFTAAGGGSYYNHTYLDVVALTTTKIVISYDSLYIYPVYHHRVIIGDVSGVTITFGVAITPFFDYKIDDNYETRRGNIARISPDTFAIIAHEGEIPNGYWGFVQLFTVIGNKITPQPERWIINSRDTNYTCIATLLSNQVVIALADVGYSPSGYGKAKVVDCYEGILCGIAQENGIAGETIPVTLGGISQVHSALVAGEPIYSQANGTLTSTYDYAYGMLVGQAISDTEILLSFRRIGYGNNGLL